MLGWEAHEKWKKNVNKQSLLNIPPPHLKGVTPYIRGKYGSVAQTAPYFQLWKYMNGPIFFNVWYMKCSLFVAEAYLIDKAM